MTTLTTMPDAKLEIVELPAAISSPIPKIRAPTASATCGSSRKVSRHLGLTLRFSSTIGCRSSPAKLVTLRPALWGSPPYRPFALVRGWSQEKFAFEAGIHRTYVSDIARGARNPTIHAEMARPEGLEPPASRFEAWRSIQLS